MFQVVINVCFAVIQSSLNIYVIIRPEIGFFVFANQVSFSSVNSSEQHNNELDIYVGKKTHLRLPKIKQGKSK